MFPGCFNCGFHANNVDFMQIRWNMLNKPTYEWIEVYDQSIVARKEAYRLTYRYSQNLRTVRKISIRFTDFDK